MVLLDKLWDDILAGPQPDRGLGKLRKIAMAPVVVGKDEGESSGAKLQRSVSISESSTTPTTPTTPSTPSPRSRENVWRSVFNPGSNLATKAIGAEIFDKPHPNSPTIYDWLYSGETKSTHR
ncbi:dormancy-associated protein-like 1 [Wolffia australiana]